MKIAAEQYQKSLMDVLRFDRNCPGVVPDIQPIATEMRAELCLRKLDPGRCSLALLDGNPGAWWKRDDGPARLVSYKNGKSLAEELRGKSLPDYCAEFRRLYPGGQPHFVLSFGDAGVNRNYAALTRDSLLCIPQYVRELQEHPRRWIVCYQNGQLSIESLVVEAAYSPHEEKPRPIACERAGRPGNILRYISWALTGIPAVIDGNPNLDALFIEDDDVRHAFVLPRWDGVCIFNREVLCGRAAGWKPTAPLESDLADYGEPKQIIPVLQSYGYQLVGHCPSAPGEFQFVAANRIRVRLRESGYPISMLGICSEDGALAHYICSARSDTSGKQYFAPSIASQLTLAAPYFRDAFILDEGLDPLFYDFSVPPESFPVRGRKGGLLSAVIVVYE